MVLGPCTRAAVKVGLLPYCLQVVEAAHKVGLRTSSTIMFGHLDSTASWARHIAALRDLQARTGGITEFVPLPFVHMEAPVYLKGDATTRLFICRVYGAALCAHEGPHDHLKGCDLFVHVYCFSCVLYSCMQARPAGDQP